MDDSGSNVLIEYIFMILIMASFFTIFILLLSNVIGTSNRVVIGQGLSVVSNDLANRIVAFSGKVSIDQYNNSHWVSNISSNTEEIDLPDMVEGKPYLVEVTYEESTMTGAIKVTYEDDRSINSTAHFRSYKGDTIDIATLTITPVSSTIRINARLRWRKTDDGLLQIRGRRVRKSGIPPDLRILLTSFVLIFTIGYPIYNNYVDSGHMQNAEKSFSILASNANTVASRNRWFLHRR